MNINSIKVNLSMYINMLKFVKQEVQHGLQKYDYYYGEITDDNKIIKMSNLYIAKKTNRK